MARSWLYKYGEDYIKVVNKNFNGSELYINSELCAKKTGADLTDYLSTTLKGGETVTATLGGVLTTKCYLRINGTLLQPVEVK